MQRIATVRIVLAFLGVVFLLANPAGACAGMMAGLSSQPSHPCCPKPSGDLAKSACLCIDRQPAAPAVPSPGEQTQDAVVAPAPSMLADVPVEVPESLVSEDVSPAPHAILLSIHQLLL